MEILKKNIPIIISLFIAIVAGVMIYTFLKSASPTIPVVVAKDNIFVGQEITKDTMTVTQYPKSMVPSTSFGSISEVEGKIVVNGPIISGNMVRAENISDSSSLRASLDTYATNPGWTAIELPPGGALGMSSLRRGDKVDIYSELGNEQGMVVGLICQDAIILDKPVKDKSDQFIVAVPKEYAAKVAELIILNKPMTLTLNNTMEVVQESLPVEETPETEETSEQGGSE